MNTQDHNLIAIAYCVCGFITLLLEIVADGIPRDVTWVRRLEFAAERFCAGGGLGVLVLIFKERIL